MSVGGCSVSLRSCYRISDSNNRVCSDDVINRGLIISALDSLIETGELRSWRDLPQTEVTTICTEEGSEYVATLVGKETIALLVGMLLRRLVRTSCKSWKVPSIVSGSTPLIRQQ